MGNRLVAPMSLALAVVLLPVLARAFDLRPTEPSLLHPADTLLADAIRVRIEWLSSGADPGDEILPGWVPTLTTLYAERVFAPIWWRNGSLRAEARALLGELRNSRADGLTPAAYGIPLLDSLVEGSGGEPQAAARAELLLSHAFLRLGSDLSGRETRRWLEERLPASERVLLPVPVSEDDPDGPGDALRAVAGGLDLRAGLNRLRPSHGPYRALARHLPALLEPAPRPAVERPSSGPPDGQILPVAGPSRSDTLRHVLASMERWRWFDGDLEVRHIRVEIPAFEAVLATGGREIRRHRVIVGRTDRPTPVFSARLTHLILAPDWWVPPTIARQDILPRLRADPGYLQARGMVLLDRTTFQPVAPASVDWSRVGGDAFVARYAIRQGPGPRNALGRVKFVFPNPFAVYLHDTPDRKLFDEAIRAFSSGCVRLDDPLAFAAATLDDEAWNQEVLTSLGTAEHSTTVNIPDGLPVYLTYHTAWVDGDGALRLGPDLYGWNVPLLEALAAFDRIPQPGGPAS